MLNDNIQKNYGDFSTMMNEDLKDPAYAAMFLNTAIVEYLEDGDTKSFIAILGYIVKSGNLSQLAKTSNISRTQLYRLIKGEADPSFPKMLNLLHSLGFQFIVQPIEKSA